MHRDGTGGRFARLEEPGEDVVGRVRPVLEVQVDVVDARVLEPRRLVALLVEPHNQSHVALLKVGYIVVWGQRVVALDGFVRQVRAREGDELALHAPAEVAVLDLLVVLVVRDVEVGIGEETELSSPVEASQGVKDGQQEGAVRPRGVVPGDEGGLVPLERTEGVLRGHAQMQHAPRTDKEYSVRAPMAMCTAVIVNGVVPVARVRELAVEQLAEAIYVPEVERPEVEEEIPVDELPVDGEEAVLVGRGGRRGQGDVEEPAGEDLHRAPQGPPEVHIYRRRAHYSN